MSKLKLTYLSSKGKENKITEFLKNKNNGKYYISHPWDTAKASFKKIKLLY